MEYKPDIIFDNDEQNLNEFYNTIYIDSLKFKKETILCMIWSKC